MKLVELTKYHKLYEDQGLYELVGACMFYPTEGKVQNIAQSVYGKHQGHVYLAYEEEVLIGLVGIRMIDRKAEIFQISVKKELQRKGHGSTILETLSKVIQPIADAFMVVLSPNTENFFINNGFERYLQVEGNPDLGLETVYGRKDI